MRAQWKEHCKRMYEKNDLADKPMTYVWVGPDLSPFLHFETQSKTYIETLRKDVKGDSSKYLYPTNFVPNCYSLSVWYRMMKTRLI